MKKLIVILTVMVVMACSMVTVSAASKDALIEKMKEVPAANNGIFYNGAVAEIKKAKLTEEQIDKLIVILDKAKTIIPKNDGTKARDYTKEQQKQVIDLLNEACEITGYSYKILHEGGGSFELIVYTPEKTVAFIYDDGQLVGKTGAEFNPTYLCLAGAVLALASAAAVIIFRKKSEANG